MTPFALWTQVLLKGGEAMLDSMQAAVKRSRPGVAVIPTPDAPAQPVAARKAKPAKQAKKAKPAPKRKARARSAKASARRR